MKSKYYVRLLFFCLISLLIQGTSVFAESNMNSSDVCNNSSSKSIEQYVTICLDLPIEIRAKSDDGSSIKFPLNINLLNSQNLIVYGSPKDISNNDYKNGQFRYLGRTDSGGLFPNVNYPEDLSGENHITKRNLIYRPWESPTENHTATYKPSQPYWWKDYSREDIADQLSRVQDKYYATSKSPEGDFSKLNKGVNWADWLYNYAIFSQPSTKYSPGLITEMHRSYVTGDIYYDSFVLAPKNKPFGDLWVDPDFIVFTNPKAGQITDVKIKVFSSFDTPGFTKLYYKFDNESQPHLIDVWDIPAEHWDSVNKKWILGELDITISKITMPYWGKVIVGSGPVTIASSSSTSQVKLASAFIVNLNPNHDSPPLEFTLNKSDGFANNRVEWELTRILKISDPIKTPPMKVNSITPYDATPYWDDIKYPDLDKYVSKCSPSYKTNYEGSLTSFALSGLTPNTNYTCNLEAFDKDGNSGGVTTASFKTKPLASDLDNGFWKDRGLIREINNAHQSVGNIPTEELDFSQYAAKQVKEVANQYSPYFSESLGVFAKPAIKTTTHYWRLFAFYCETEEIELHS